MEPPMLNPFLFIFQTGLDFATTAMRAEAQGKAYAINEAELYRAANIEEARAIDAVARGGVAASRIRQEGARAAAAAQAAFVAGNVEASTGTAAMVQGASSMLAEYDAQVAKNNAVREAFGFRESGRRLRAQREQLRTEHIAQRQSEIAGLASRSIGGFASMAGGAAKGG
jgi:hypothetical protein